MNPQPVTSEQGWWGLWLVGFTCFACWSVFRLEWRDDRPRYGSVEGQVQFDGVPPFVSAIVTQSAALQNSRGEGCPPVIPDEQLVVDPNSQGIRDVFVYIRKVQQIHPDLQTTFLPEVVVTTDNCRFIPHAIFARTSQLIRVVNAGNFGRHTAHTYQIHQFGTAFSPERDKKLQFTIPEPRPFQVKCDAHWWMSAYWLILDHPYASITSSDGKFQIRQLPAGKHQLILWHQSAGYIEKGSTITIRPGRTTKLGTIKFAQDKFNLRRQ